jgi:hypothetical protein
VQAVSRTALRQSRRVGPDHLVVVGKAAGGKDDACPFVPARASCQLNPPLLRKASAKQRPLLDRRQVWLVWRTPPLTAAEPLSRGYLIRRKRRRRECVSLERPCGCTEPVL